jgi:hypothetical protein
VNIRAALNSHPTISTAGAVVLLAFCLGAVGWQLMGSETEPWREATYFYDLNTGRIFIAAPSEAPIPAPSGSTADGKPAGVRARIYACGDCRDSYAGMTTKEVAESDAELTFIQRPMEEQENGDQASPEATAYGPPELGYRTEVALPGEREWASVLSSRAQSMMEPKLQCSGSQPEPCYPKP